MNTLEIKKNESGDFVTTIKTGSVEAWELHRRCKTDDSVLISIKNRNQYQYIDDEWILSMPDEPKVFRDKKFSMVVDMALAYIHERDHPCWEDHF